MNGPPALAVWNWQTNSWDEIREANNPGTSPSKQLAYSYNGDLPDPAAHMSAAGQVRLRVVPDTTSMNMLYLNRLDLSAEGRRP
jgi:hypothetical protein